MNRQLSVWHGQQTSDPAHCPGAVQPTPGTSWRYMYASEYLTYGLGAAADVVTAQDGTANGTKEFKIADHLGSSRVALKEGGTTTEHDYEPYGSPVAGDPPRKGFIDKEVDSESNLGDFGVRKYDSDVGRFMSPDPLWEEYRAWTPYQYGVNSPVNNIDPNGDSVIVLLDEEGAGGFGHMAVLIGNNKDGWFLYSKDGTDGLEGAHGSSNSEVGTKFKTFYEFAEQTEERYARYDKAFLLESDYKADKEMKDAAESEAEEVYNVCFNSCLDVPANVLKAGGFDPGNISVSSGVPGLGELGVSVPNRSPNARYQQMSRMNEAQNYTYYLETDRSVLFVVPSTERSRNDATKVGNIQMPE